MKIKVLKLGSVCKDTATTLTGTLTHWAINIGQRIDYLLQPPGTNPDDGQPLKKINLELERLETTEDQFEEVEVPFEILGTIVTDKASGFTGMAIAFVRHINGCFHVVIQPSGRLPKTGASIKHTDFDLRGCAGDKIPELTQGELATSKVEQPSPTDAHFEEKYSR
jgi:hypothetical protein